MKRHFFGRSRFPMVCSLLTVSTMFCCVHSEVKAGEKPEDLISKIREIRVPKSMLDSWIKEDWAVVGRAEYSALVESVRALKDQPRTAWIDRAEYSAHFVDGALRAGQLKATLKHVGDKSEFIPLDPLNLALSNLHWEGKNQSPVWGTTPGGRTVLFVEGDQQSQLQGQWSLTGRRLARSVEFDLRVAPATISRIVLHLPEGHQLHSSKGQVSHPTPAEQKGWNIWRIDLGSKQACRVTVSQSEKLASVNTRPLVLFEKDASYLIKENGLQLDERLNLEVFNAPIQSLSLLLPKGFDVYSLTYGGEDSLTWQQRDQKNKRRITIQFADPLIGRSRPIRLRAFGTAKLGTKWLVPQTGLNNAVFLKGTLRLKVAAPLQIQSFESDGFRQTSAVSSEPEGGTLQFQQFLPNARVSVTLGYPPTSLTSQIVNQIIIDQQQTWALNSQIRWSVQSGSTYKLRCAIPRDWEIINVQPFGKANQSEISGWHVARNNKNRILNVEFLKAITKGSPKTIQVFARRLKKGRDEEVITIPALQPLDCETLDQLNLIFHPAAFVCDVEPVSGFRVIEDKEIPKRFQSLTFDEMRTEATIEFRSLALVSDSASATTEIHIRRIQPKPTANMRVIANVESDHISESLVLSIDRTTNPSGRVLIYITSEGPPIVWKQTNGRNVIFDSVRLPVSAHSQWNLPETGELWELHLPARLKSDFQILGSRVRQIDGTVAPMLAFLPGTSDFHGIFELRTREHTPFQIEADGLLRTEDGNNHRTNAHSETDDSTQTWLYDDVSDNVVLHKANRGTNRDDNPTATLHLKSLINIGTTGFDSHVARFEIAEAVLALPFRFQLKNPARLISLRVNGRRLNPTRNGDAFSLPALPPNQNNIVEVRYRVPTVHSGFRNKRPVPVPRCAYHVIAFEWDFAIPPDVQLASEPDSVYLARPLPNISAAQRFFGPIGRSAEQGVFNPFSLEAWTSIFTVNRGLPEVNNTTPQNSFAPQGWTVWNASSSYSAETLSVETWQTSSIYFVAWICTLTCLLIGLVFRAAGFTIPEWVPILWLYACAISAFLVPIQYAEIVGGCLSGSLLACIFPRNLLLMRWCRSKSDDGISLGSTVSYRSIPASMLLIGLVFFVSSATAQRPSPTNPNENGRTSVDSAREAYHSVVIPVDDTTNPPKPLSVVYLNRPLLDQLRTAAKGRTQRPEYIISSAVYACKIDDQLSATLEARYRIFTFSPSRKVRVTLPITNANPAGCLVNGKPQPLRRAGGEKGFVVQLVASKQADAPNSAESIDQSRQDSAEPKTTTGVPQNVISNMNRKTFEVVLKLFPPLSKTPNGAGFRIGIPAITESHLSVNFPKPKLAIRITDGDRVRIVGTAEQAMEVDLGRTPGIGVYWKEHDNAVPQIPVLEAALSYLVETRPTFFLFHCHVDYHVVSGSIDFISWQVPQNVVIREVVTNNMLRYSRLLQPSGNSNLMIEFASAQKKDFRIDATLMFPSSGRIDTLAIPALELFKNNQQQARINITRQQMGVVAPSEFQLTDAPINSDSVRKISVETFVKNLTTSTGSRKPQFAFELLEPSTVPVRLLLLTPQRKTWTNQVAVIGESQLVLTMTAEVETSTAPAFQHVLEVDSRLKIDSVTVVEDGATRINRWTRTGNQLILFLNGKTTGIQNITMNGHMPLRIAEETRLPLIRFQDTETAESNLQIYRNPAIDIDLLNIEQLTVDDRLIETDDATDRGVLIGQFKNTGENTELPTVRTARRAGTTHADFATRIEKRDARNWHLSVSIHLHEHIEQSSRLRIRIPPEIARQSYHIDAKNMTQSVENRADGSVDVVLETMEPLEKSPAVVISAEVTPPLTSEWLLPEITIPNALVSENILIFEQTDLEPLNSPLTELQRSDLPGWIAEPARLPSDQREWRTYRSTDGAPWLVDRQRPAVENRTLNIPLLHTTVTPDQSDRVHGHSEFLFYANGKRDLELKWPDNTILRALFVNGQETDGIKVESGIASIRIEAAAAPHLITILWVQGHRNSYPRFGTFVQSIPRPLNVTTDRSIVTFLPPKGSYSRIMSGAESVPLETLVSIQMENLLEACRLYLEFDDLIPPMWPNLVNVHSEVVRLIRQLSLSQNSQTRTSDGTLKTFHAFDTEFQQLVKQFQQLETEVSPEPTPSASVMFSSYYPQRATNRKPVLAQNLNETTSDSLTLFVVDQSVIVVALGMLGLVLAFPVTRRVAKLGLSDWFARHQSLLWGLMAVIWWLYFSFSIVGVALLVISTVSAVRRLGRGAANHELAV